MTETVRVIVDTQSNRLFRGVEMEQNYDQRGGLCQVGAGHVVITTNPINNEYLEYWQNLGFSLPHLLTAGPFDTTRTLSELIMSKPNIKQDIKSLVKGKRARLEFFCIEETERRLACELGIPAYCNFDVSIQLAKKNIFKEVCETVGLPTPFWLPIHSNEQVAKEIRRILDHNPVLVKATDGTGGISCGGMFKIEKEDDIGPVALLLQRSTEKFYLESMVADKTGEISLHWEINDRGYIKIIDIFDQLSKNFSYSGVSYPSDLPFPTQCLIEEQLMKKLGPYLVKMGGRGNYCCDIVIANHTTPYWIDLNPRKGAIVYVHDMVKRVSEARLGGAQCCFWHEHFPLPSTNEVYSFRNILNRIDNIHTPGKNPFVVITNPGVIRFGYVDVTGISTRSKEEAKVIFQEAKARLT